jgi:hypothetical protein
MAHPILTLVAPNDNARTRHQWRVADWLLLHRCLPADGDRWCGDDVDLPWWEPVLQLPDRATPIYTFWAAHAALQVRAHRYAELALFAAGHVVAYTPSGREVRQCRDGRVEFQPPNENYWIVADDLPAARRAYFAGRP